MDGLVSRDHREAARRLRALVSVYETKRDLITLGAYAKGGDRDLDEALTRMPAIEAFLRQDPGVVTPFDSTVGALRSAVA